MPSADNGSDSDSPASVSRCRLTWHPSARLLVRLASKRTQIRLPMYSNATSNNLPSIGPGQNGVKWIVRLPKAPVWNSFQQCRMTLDLFTLDFLAKNTSLPIPHVHVSSCSLDNPLSRPYTLMSFLEGTPLGDLWFNSSWMTDQRRYRVFESLALAMPQLSNFTFPKISDLVPDPEMGRATVGPIDPSADEISEEGATSEDALGPYDSTYDFLFDGIRRKSERADSHLARFALLRTFASSLPDDSYTSPPFLLAFPDYNYDNILVDGGRLSPDPLTGTALL